MTTPANTPDAYAGHKGNASREVLTNPANLAPADRRDFNPAAFANQPGAAARANGFPRLS